MQSINAAPHWRACMGTRGLGAKAGRGRDGRGARDAPRRPDPSLPSAGSRKELADYLGGELGAPRGGGPPRRGGLLCLKAYLLDADDGIPRSVSTTGVGWDMEDTGLERVKILRVRAGGAACEFYADVADKRFVVLYTAAGSDVAGRAVAAITAADRLGLDRMWLPDPLLRALARRAGAGALRGLAARRAGGFPGTGRGSSESFDLDVCGPLACEADRQARRNRRLAGAMACRKITLVSGAGDGPLGHACVDIVKDGRLAARSGGSLHGHLRLVDEARALYADVVGGIEECRPGSMRRDGELDIVGCPVHIRLCDPLRDVGAFVDRLFDSTRPLRLWGLPSVIEEGYYNVVGMDIHTASPMSFEIASNMMRVYLSGESRGSAILRLLCNLQDIFGAAARCRRVEELVR